MEKLRLHLIRGAAIEFDNKDLLCYVIEEKYKNNKTIIVYLVRIIKNVKLL